MIEIKRLEEIKAGDKIVVPDRRIIQGRMFLEIMEVEEVGMSEIVLRDFPLDYIPDDTDEILVWNEG